MVAENNSPSKGWKEVHDEMVGRGSGDSEQRENEDDYTSEVEEYNERMDNGTYRFYTEPPYMANGEDDLKFI